MAMAGGPSGRKPIAVSLSGLVDVASRTHGLAVAGLVLMALLAFLPGFFTIPPIDRDEARFAQATKQMIETGDFVDIRFQEQTRYKKPVGIYWLQAAAAQAVEATGLSNPRTRIAIYRIPSLIGAVGAVLLTYWAALAFVGRRSAYLAGLMMASSFLLGIEARLATTDAVLLACAVAAMGAFGRLYLAERGAYVDHERPLLAPAILWTALAAGILVKGPLILLFVALPAAALAAADRSGRFLLRLRPVAGLAWMLVLALPWFLAIVARSGGSFFADSVGGDFLSKVGAAQETHWGPPGYYFALFWLAFFPASILAPLAFGAVWRSRDEPGIRFLLAWIGPTWIAFELAMTKLPHYVLPLYPAIAILIALAIERDALSKARWLRPAPVWWFILTALAAVGAIALHVMVGQQPGFAAWPFAAGAVIFALFAWRLYEVDGVETSLLRAIMASILVSATLFGATFPYLRTMFPSRHLFELVRDPPCENPGFVTAGYHEPSLVFLVGTELRHAAGGGAADFLAGGPCRFAFVEKGQERAFIARAEAIGLRYAPGPRVDGFNVSSGRPVSIALYRGVGR